MMTSFIKVMKNKMLHILGDLQSQIENLRLSGLKRIDFAELNAERIIIFAHYDPDELFDRTFLYLIDKLKLDLKAKVMVVSTSTKLPPSQIELISKHIECLIVKKNYGRDFASWKLGIRELGSLKPQSLILANDTLYGPFNNLTDFILKVEGASFATIGGLTNSFETGYHLQSYFLVFNSTCLKSVWFNHYWKSYRIHQSREQTIKSGEMGLSQSALKAGIHLIAKCNYKDVRTLILNRKSKIESWQARIVTTDVNPYHFMWRELIENFDFPFIKVELLKLNPWQIADINNYKSVIAERSDYPAEIIENHLSRVRTKPITSKKGN